MDAINEPEGDSAVVADDGLLVIKDASDYTNDLDYLKIGNTNKPLVIAIQNFRTILTPTALSILTAHYILLTILSKSGAICH